MNPPEPDFWTKTSWIQIGYSLWVNQAQLVIGLAFGFTAVTLPQIKVSTAETAWIASILPLMSPIGCVISGCLLDIVGRSTTLILCMLPTSVGWFITAIGDDSFYIIVGRVLTGIGIGMSSAPPWTYSTEIALPKMRGILGVIPTISIASGLSLQAFLGSILHWKQLCNLWGSYCFALMVSNYFLPETPYYVLMHGNIEQTRRALAKFRSNNYYDGYEIEELTDFKTKNEIRQHNIKDKMQILFSRAACKPFSIILVYCIISQCSGISIVIFYTVDVLEHANVSVDPYHGNVVLCLVRLLFSIPMAVLLFQVKRRPIALGSSLATSLVCVLICIGTLHVEEPSMFPLILFVWYIIAATFGYYTLPMLMLFELIPLQIRGILGGLTISVGYFLVSFTNSMYPYLLESIGFSYTFLCFGVISLIGFIFLFLYLPETKALSLADIEEFYRGRRDSLHRRRSTFIDYKHHNFLHKATPIIKNIDDPEVPETLKKQGSSIRFNLEGKEVSEDQAKQSHEEQAESSKKLTKKHDKKTQSPEDEQNKSDEEDGNYIRRSEKESLKASSSEVLANTSKKTSKKHKKSNHNSEAESQELYHGSHYYLDDEQNISAEKEENEIKRDIEKLLRSTSNEELAESSKKTIKQHKKRTRNPEPKSQELYLGSSSYLDHKQHTPEKEESKHSSNEEVEDSSMKIIKQHKENTEIAKNKSKNSREDELYQGSYNYIATDNDLNNTAESSKQNNSQNATKLSTLLFDDESETESSRMQIKYHKENPRLTRDSPTDNIENNNEVSGTSSIKSKEQNIQQNKDRSSKYKKSEQNEHPSSRQDSQVSQRILS